jgi:hypothetical protein
MDEPIFHPDHEALERYSRSELTPEEGSFIEEHLRSGCALCQRKVDDVLLQLELSLGNAASYAGEGGTAGFDLGWDRLISGLGQRLSQARGERAAAPRLVAELVATAAADRLALLRDRPELRTPAVCDFLLERSFSRGFPDPAQAMELADLAVGVAEQLDTSFYGPRSCRICAPAPGPTWATRAASLPTSWVPSRLWRSPNRTCKAAPRIRWKRPGCSTSKPPC